jgi:alpha-galactosidase
MNIKISLIGAGSGAFSLSLIRDLCLTENLSGCTISFMDIDPHRLEGSYGLCRRYADELGVRFHFEKTLRREVSLQGADFVINTALAAGHHRLQAGWDIARQYGYRWGGSLAIMHDEAFWINFHQLRLFDEIAEDILHICPDAWYLQVANPVFGGTTYLTRKYPGLKMVGLCHGFSGIYHVAALLGLDRQDLVYEMPGVNHFLWLTKLQSRGEDMLPRFAEWVENESSRYFETCGMSDHMGPKPVDIYKRFGVAPIGDTVTVGGGAWGWWYHLDDDTEMRWQEDPRTWWNGYFTSVERTARENYRISQDPNARVTDYLEPVKSQEQMVPIIESIACNIPHTYIVNIPNTGGLVPGLAEDLAVEVPAAIDESGVRGTPTSGLPTLALQTLIHDRVVPWEIELEAYLMGSRRLLVELVALDPWTGSFPQARQFVSEILAMPEHEEMRRHYG